MKSRNTIVLVLLSFAVAISLTACQQAEDVYGVEGYTEALEEYNQQLEEAAGAEDMAEAMREYNQKVEDLRPKLEKLREEAPEVLFGEATTLRGVSKEQIQKLTEEINRMADITEQKYKADYMEEDAFAEAWEDLQQTQQWLRGD